MIAADPPVPVHDPDEVRRTAERILAGDGFEEPSRSFVERLLDWLRNLWDRLFPDADPTGFGGGGGAGGSSAATVAVFLAAFVVVVVLTRALRGTWRRKRTTVTVAADDVEVEGRRSAEAWEALARRLEAEGRWSDAMRARFGSLVERLVDRGFVPDVPGRTSGELRADVRSTLPGAADAFADAAELFERAWYGGLPTGPEEAGRFATGAERVLDAVGTER